MSNRTPGQAVIRIWNLGKTSIRTRVVDQDVEALMRLEDGIHRRVDSLAVRDIEHDERNCATQS